MNGDCIYKKTSIDVTLSHLHRNKIVFSVSIEEEKTQKRHKEKQNRNSFQKLFKLLPIV
jgi:uncharacterized protein (UPF0218 family)